MRPKRDQNEAKSVRFGSKVTVLGGFGRVLGGTSPDHPRLCRTYRVPGSGTSSDPLRDPDLDLFWTLFGGLGTLGGQFWISFGGPREGVLTEEGRLGSGDPSTWPSTLDSLWGSWEATF